MVEIVQKNSRTLVIRTTALKWNFRAKPVQQMGGQVREPSAKDAPLFITT